MPRWPADHVAKWPARSIGQKRASRAGLETKPKPDDVQRPVRKCLSCRGPFKAETRFMFMCVGCRRATGGIDAR